MTNREMDGFIYRELSPILEMHNDFSPSLNSTDAIYLMDFIKQQNNIHLKVDNGRYFIECLGVRTSDVNFNIVIAKIMVSILQTREMHGKYKC